MSRSIKCPWISRNCCQFHQSEIIWVQMLIDTHQEISSISWYFKKKEEYNNKCNAKNSEGDAENCFSTTDSGTALTRLSQFGCFSPTSFSTTGILCFYSYSCFSSQTSVCVQPLLLFWHQSFPLNTSLVSTSAAQEHNRWKPLKRFMLSSNTIIKKVVTHICISQVFSFLHIFMINIIKCLIKNALCSWRTRGRSRAGHISCTICMHIFSWWLLLHQSH